ncbi:activated RNA polymerase II transcriptional coactivator p15-like protein [Dinothrombium tinctorium]|uniref:Activated RNA polymerase II transcriptional coactivator p15-like protein n=1 Tax=Dinothrombium tinctorium TaxID=1965070 RepID=A0A443RCH0_9ACAR|nr:activated RNA polymerase II transcriptional coactivator p15-like protein [Dinothrombium tinctorium]RWS12969.1 activated RNA polymerase II transcriptional coactivator p15-like protein [Dinothrombium tinctorium]
MASASGEDEKKFQLSNNRFVTVSQFRHKTRIDIREYYVTDDGVRKPGKKGISLSLQEWKKLKEQMDEIEKAIVKCDSDSD